MGGEWFFLLLGLGFFLYVIHLIERNKKSDDEMEIKKMREFGIPTEGKRFHRKLRNQ